MLSFLIISYGLGLCRRNLLNLWVFGNGPHLCGRVKFLATPDNLPEAPSVGTPDQSMMLFSRTKSLQVAYAHGEKTTMNQSHDLSRL